MDHLLRPSLQADMRIWFQYLITAPHFQNHALVHSAFIHGFRQGFKVRNLTAIEFQNDVSYLESLSFRRRFG